MRRALPSLGLSALLVTGVLAAPAFAEEPATAPADAPPVAPATAPPIAPPVATAAPVEPAVPRPKFGDVSFSGYFRGAFGASNHGGRMTCFKLALPGSLFSKYRLGNECEVW